MKNFLISGTLDSQSLRAMAVALAMILAHPPGGAAEEAEPALHDPVWSPTGETIAFYSNVDGDFDIYLLDLATGDVTQLTTHPGHDSSPAWSPDGKRLSFKSKRDGTSDLYLLALDTKEITRLTDDDTNEMAQSWSPDGRWIAFETRRDGNADIYVVSVDGGREARLTWHEGNDFRPSWCAGDERILIQSKHDEVYQVFSMAPDGSELTQLTEGGSHRAAPVCGPETGRIAYVLHEDSGKSTIRVMDPDGSADMALTADSGGNDLAPSWSPTERRIVFYSDRNGSLELFVMQADGSRQRRLEAYPTATVSAAYRLPFSEGEAYSVLQSFDGRYGHTEAARFAVDFKMPIGTTVVAARGGQVVAVAEEHANAEPRKPEPGNENYIIIAHGDGTFGRYYHLDQGGSDVAIGDLVEPGQAIGRSGNSGASFGPHLHFDVTEGCYDWGCQTVRFRFASVTDDPLIEGETYTRDPG